LEVIRKIWRFGFYFFLQDLANLNHFFFHGKSFVWVGRDHKFSGRNLAKFFPPQKKKKKKKEKATI
jgi:hypothetical protein